MALPEAISGPAVKAESQNEDWRSKYFDCLREMETEERQFRAMEVTLKRLAGRLCIASSGQSPQLDGELKQLQGALRGDAEREQLDALTTALTDAIHALDHVPAAPLSEATPQPAPAMLDEQRMRAILVALLDELRRDAALGGRITALDNRLASSLQPEQLPEVLSDIADIVGQRIQHIERAKQEIETLLGQMVGKLDEIARFVVDQNQNQHQSLASSESLNTQLASEMRAMGEHVETSADLQQLRTQVRGRLDTIGQHLQEFRQRETTRATLIGTRNEQMRVRVAELEAEATRLHNQLKEEQRLSSVDVLTQLPNRLAYEKRIAEELQRWQRFAQPTTVIAWDVDHFKRVNDSYGHRAGDRVLRAVADCLASRLRSTDFLARYGGEEFVMILVNTSLADGLRLTDAMRVAIGALKFHFRGTPISITISGGITALQTGDDAGTAFERADKALYAAKEGGRNCCVSG